MIPTIYQYLRASIESRFATDEEGAGLVEYILLVSMVILIVLGAVALFRSRLIDGYNNAGETVSNAS